MSSRFSFRALFVPAALAFSAVMAVMWSLPLFGTENLMIAAFQPLGGDFINLHAAGKLVLAGRIDEIYAPEAFMTFERTIIDADMGLRLWVYPPHSLFFVWPFGILPFVPSYIAWSMFGLVALWLAGRRYRFSNTEALLLIASPASIACILLGQTGNVATALVLLALSARRDGDPIAVGGTAALTVKPQTGFLVPLLWLMRGEWRLIAYTSVTILVVTGVSYLVFGGEAWLAYLGDTMPTLTELETEGTGPFQLMIPSVFMALRLFGLDGGLALSLHLGFAVLILLWLAGRLYSETNRERQNVMLLVGVCLITPYLHLYDLTLLSAAVLIMLRGSDDARSMPMARNGFMVFAWLLPALLMTLNAAGLPVAPLGLLALFALI